MYQSLLAQIKNGVNEDTLPCNVKTAFRLHHRQLQPKEFQNFNSI